MQIRAKQRLELEEIVARPSAPAGLVRRARVILLSADGVPGVEIAGRLDLSREQVSRIRARFRAEGVAGLTARPKPGRQDHAVPRETVERVVQLVKVTHKLTEAHTAVDFLGFMKKVVRAYPNQELHVILDNSSTHSTPDIAAWLAEHPEVHFHYTPTSASWLNQVEGFFGILGKQSLGVTSFNSKRALRDHLNAFMRSWNSNPTPFAWTKPASAIIRSHRRMLDRISTAVH
jgi:transposase